MRLVGFGDAPVAPGLPETGIPAPPGLRPLPGQYEQPATSSQSPSQPASQTPPTGSSSSNVYLIAAAVGAVALTLYLVTR